MVADKAQEADEYKRRLKNKPTEPRPKSKDEIWAEEKAAMDIISARNEKISKRVGKIGAILFFCLFGYFVAPWFGVPIPITVGFILISSIGIIFMKSP